MAVPRYTLIRGEFYTLYPDLPRNGPEPDGVPRLYALRRAERPAPDVASQGS